MHFSLHHIVRPQGILVLLCVCVLGLMPLRASAEVTVRPYVGAQPAAQMQVQSEESCDDGSVGGTLVQELEDWYGNAFATSCSGARVTRVRFQHISYGLPGPYLFRLHLVDGACHSVGQTAVLQTDAGDGEPTWVEVDVSDMSWCVAGEYQILLEPLTCSDALGGGDCFPALVIDASSSTEAGTHCGVVSTLAGFDRSCAAPRSADGRYFDFALRPEIECLAQSCSTAVRPESWSLLKSLYRSP